MVERQLVTRDIHDERVLDAIVGGGFDPQYGARPLKRAIRRYLEEPLARTLLAGDVAAGDTLVARPDGSAPPF